MSQRYQAACQPQRQDYTAAIICPMGVELTPVLALLDEEHKSLSVSRDQNAYMLGRMGQHNVVVAAMPTTGNNSASIVVTQLLNDFGRVRFGLLVGVGGGIPDEDYEEEGLHDIRLGDVVVSKAQDGFGGVVQFDRGKSTLTGFVKTGHLNKPPHVLASNMELLRAQHSRRGNNITQYLNEMLNKNPYMEDEYSCPGAERDRLFQADYPHEGGKSCKNCDIARAVQRKAPKRPHPQIHYGTIGSSNLAIEETVKRDELCDTMDILCVEMEAAGLMEAFPCLVIRGICDYADSHKNKTWQPYAAATAASYAKELLLQIPPESIKQALPIEELMRLFAKKKQARRNTRMIEGPTQNAEEGNLREMLVTKDREPEFVES